jgi:hypothetical protein
MRSAEIPGMPLALYAVERCVEEGLDLGVDTLQRDSVRYGRRLH